MKTHGKKKEIRNRIKLQKKRKMKALKKAHDMK